MDEISHWERKGHESYKKHRSSTNIGKYGHKLNDKLVFTEKDAM